MIEVRRLSESDVLAQLDALTELLRDAVDGGASISFIAPLSYEDGAAYWRKAAAAVANGSRIVLVAREDGALVGTAQLDLAGVPNGRHRAEAQKIIVHSSHRRRGIGLALMNALEQAAVDAGRTLIVLDTEQDGGAERLYEKSGYQRVGVIPKFAMRSDGTLRGTVLFYRHLDGE